MILVPLFDLTFLEELAAWVQELQIGGASIARGSHLARVPQGG